ncbi:TetR/AcrR family transcriptional regulator [Azotosporobacter soli]|uniref:TetR/AcrR family transcriptional regulator n=1 Tax=Azotosporobacter soli TaxID=3055040 RepID=UPI0031FEBC40
MRKKAVYKSAIRSRHMIRQAFIELMNEKPLEKITVTDVIVRANINRGTFYAHYQDVRAVIEQIENEIIEKTLLVLRDFHYIDFFQDPYPLLSKISAWLETDLEFYRILICSPGAEQFLFKLRKIFLEYLESNSDIPDSLKNSQGFYIRANFFAGGIVHLYQLWFQNELPISFNELSLEVSKLLIDTSSELTAIAQT